jgi:hypothetical protein
MSDPFHYTREKLYQATDCLVRGTRSIQERLESAAIYLIRLEAIKDFPPDLQGEFEEIMHELTKVSAKGDEGTLQATLRETGDMDASKLAERIFSLYLSLRGGI